MKTTIEIGTKVERIAPETDYTNGRKGEVIELDNENGRARVYWTEEKGGRPITKYSHKAGEYVPSGIRTWVKFSALKVIN